jgi:putative addiction module component (TIGR02574 family)
MPMTKAQILAEAKNLGQREREELVEDLRQIIVEEELTAEQRAELRRRAKAMDRGEATLLPGDQVMRELRERLSQP